MVEIGNLINLAGIVALGVLLLMLIRYILNKRARAKIDKWSKRHIPLATKHIHEMMDLLAALLSLCIIALFVYLGLKQLDIATTSIESVTPAVIAAIVVAIIVILGFTILRIVGKYIERLGNDYSKLVSLFVQAILLFAIVLTVAEFLGIKATAFLEIFRVIIYTVGLVIAISLGIALGWTMKDKVRKLLP